MNENEAASTRADGETLSISEAAAALGVSERTVRRRCERGEIAAQMETGESGGRVWRVDRAAISERAAKSSDRADSVRTDRRADVRPSVRPHSESESGVRPKRAAKSSGRAAKRADSDARVLAAETEARVLREALQRERENADQWRAQVEAANRQAAESAAALREYLKLSAKQLEGREYSQVESAKLAEVGAQKSAENALEAQKTGAAVKATGVQKNTAQSAARREARPLWKVVLGLR